MANPLRLPAALPVGLGYPCVSPLTLDRCGGGSIDDAEVVNEDNGSVDAGVDVRRSE